MNHFAIAIDGPAGAGKSTVAKIIADRLNIIYIDTGAMYRAFTFKLLNNKVDLNDIDTVIQILKKTSIDFKENHIYLDGNIVDNEIRENIVNNNVSKVATIKEVRERLVELQREIAKSKSTIMDGRDIASTVLKDAKYKFYVTASVDERANRRYKELKLKDESVSLDSIKSEIEKRDEMDSTREISPLIKSADAIEIDTTNETIDETVERILKMIEVEE